MLRVSASGDACIQSCGEFRHEADAQAHHESEMVVNVPGDTAVATYRYNIV